jgi:diguanylate cyclase (GGDEF)-like protein/PAS domain S-box-containing protein
MDYRSVFSALSFVAFFVYMYIGLYTYKHNKKSIVNRVFLLLCTSYAIWSFAYAFAYISYDHYVFSIWNKISALGWCSFSAISLYLVLLITDNQITKNRIVKILIFSPAIIFLYMSVFLFGEGINTPTIISDIFYIGNFWYNFIFLFMSIILIFFWGIKTDSKRIKIQSKILVVSSVVPFCLNLLMQTLLPLIGYKKFPLMGQLYSVIMILGTYIVIEKYKFLRIPEKVVFEEVENKIIDMIIVVNEKGELIKISKNTLDMLEFQESELLNKNITVLFNDDNKKYFTLSNLMQEEVRYNDIDIIMKNGEGIPVNIYCIPIWDNKIHDFLGAAIVMQDISIEYELRRKNEELFEKTIRDGLTKLYNHQYSVEIIKREINELKEDTTPKALSLMMIDIDYFKRVNDTYGHLFGDDVLKTIANILMNNIHDNGYVGRFGGEEFIIILDKTGLDKAYEISEKIRNEIENYNFNENLKLTVSIGLKQYENQLYIDLLKEADDLLYKAKQNGRNRVEYSC